MTLIDELRSRASTTADDDVQFIEQTLVWKAADRIAELEAALREIARPTYGTEINDTDAERASILGRHLVRFQRIALEALKPKPTKQ